VVVVVGGGGEGQVGWWDPFGGAVFAFSGFPAAGADEWVVAFAGGTVTATDADKDGRTIGNLVVRRGSRR
jgi:hypothetical protein